MQQTQDKEICYIYAGVYSSLLKFDIVVYLPLSSRACYLDMINVFPSSIFFIHLTYSNIVGHARVCDKDSCTTCDDCCHFIFSYRPA